MFVISYPRPINIFVLMAALIKDVGAQGLVSEQLAK